MKLIDADALIIKVRDLVEEYERRMPNWSMNDMLTSGRDAAAKWGYKADGVEDALKLIIDAPIIKAESIKHGRWIVKNGNGEYGWCSECGNRSWTQWDGVMPIPLLTPFCPYCSARMDGDENEQEKED